MTREQAQQDQIDRANLIMNARILFFTIIGFIFVLIGLIVNSTAPIYDISVYGLSLRVVLISVLLVLALCVAWFSFLRTLRRIDNIFQRVSESTPTPYQRTDYDQFWGGLGIAILGVILVALATYSSGANGSTYFFGALATGIYFVGVNLIMNSIFKKDPRIDEILKKIDNI
jgi:hypothetical protein